VLPKLVSQQPTWIDFVIHLLPAFERICRVIPGPPLRDPICFAQDSVPPEQVEKLRPNA
jgi:hypothetical protein